MELGLKGKSVLILAASKGLGRATAMQFALEGAKVFIASRNSAELKKTADFIKENTGNEQVNYMVCDITNAQSIKNLVSEVAERNKTIDVLINNAGGPPAGNFSDFDDEGWQSAFELNLLSFIRVIREVLPYMQKQSSGKIMNIASSSIKQTLDNLILSNTFRAGIAGLSKSLSQELAADNILINTIGPGKIATDRVVELDEKQAVLNEKSVDNVRERSMATIPLKRYGTPEEFAKILVFLSSEANSYVTGQTLLVDGGLIKAL